MATLTITVDDAEVQAAIDRLAAAGADLSEPMKDVAKYLLRSTMARFASQAAPDGSPWAPISAAWAKRKAKLGGGREILVFRGYLSGRAGGNLSATSDANSAQVGTNLPYGAIHQFGFDGTILRRLAPTARRRDAKPHPPSSPGAGFMPARPWLGLSDRDRDTLVEIFTDFFNAVAGGVRAV